MAMLSSQVAIGSNCVLIGMERRWSLLMRNSSWLTPTEEPVVARFQQRALRTIGALLPKRLATDTAHQSVGA